MTRNSRKSAVTWCLPFLLLIAALITGCSGSDVAFSDLSQAWTCEGEDCDDMQQLFNQIQDRTRQAWPNNIEIDLPSSYFWCMYKETIQWKFELKTEMTKMQLGPKDATIILEGDFLIWSPLFGKNDYRKVRSINQSLHLEIMEGNNTVTFENGADTGISQLGDLLVWTHTMDPFWETNKVGTGLCCDAFPDGIYCSKPYKIPWSLIRDKILEKVRIVFYIAVIHALN